MEYKGVAVETLRALVKAKGHSESDFDKHLDARLAQLLRTTMPIDWIAAADGAALYDTASRIIFPEKKPADRLRAIGHEAALHDLRGIYRPFMRIASVPFVIKRAADLWGKYYRRGHAIARELGPKGASFELTEFPDFPTPLHDVTAGYVAGTVELTGAREVKVSFVRINGGFRWDIHWA